MSTQNVHTLIVSEGLLHVRLLTHSEFIQLMDDDLVCLIGLTLLVDPSCRREFRHVVISQLSLSLYLMTQCQMKLHHPLTSLAQTLDYIEVARHSVPSQLYTLDQLLLKLTEHKIVRYIPVDRLQLLHRHVSTEGMSRSPNLCFAPNLTNSILAAISTARCTIA